MRTPEECIAQAVECEKMAAKAAESTAKTTLLTMAGEWRKLAAQSAEIQAIQATLPKDAD
jgi:hypothetical protein